MRFSFLYVRLSLVVLGAFAGFARAQAPSFESYPTPREFDLSDTAFMSDDGSTVVGRWNGTPSGSSHAGSYAAVWRRTGPLNVIALPGLGDSLPGGISADGQTLALTTIGNQPRQAYTWNQATGATRIGQPVVSDSFGSGISRDARYAAGIGTYLPFAQRLDGSPAFLWPSLWQDMWPKWISNDGSTLVGRAETTGYMTFHASRSAAVFLDRSLPNAVAGDGTAAGYYWGNGRAEGFTWDGTTLNVLEGLDPSADSAALATSNNGTAVLGGTTGLGFWYWSAASGTVPLGDFLTAQGLNIGNLEISGVVGISDDGLRLSGTATDPLGTTTYLWFATIPAPQSAGPLVLVVAMAARRRRRGALLTGTRLRTSAGST